MIVAALVAAGCAISASLPDTAESQMIVTALPSYDGARPQLAPGDLSVMEGNRSVPVLHLERLNGDLAGMQLFIYLDDSSRTMSVSLQLNELKKFVAALPPSVQVAVGYMRNGTFDLAQGFTTDHRKAANSLRLPMGIPGENGSPYFALSSLVKHWPSNEPANRRAVLMLTDGVDRYYTAPDMDDPYQIAAAQEALRHGVTVYSIYVRGAGAFGRSAWGTDIAQSRLIEVSQETGGYVYFQGFTDPVSIAPFLKDLTARFENQYALTIAATGEKGFRPVKLRTEVPGVKVSGPTRIYVP